MIETMKITVTTPTLTPRMVNDERSLLARNVSSAMSEDSFMSSNRMGNFRFQISDCRLKIADLVPRNPEVFKSAILILQSSIGSLRSQCLNRIQFRCAPGGPQSADNSDNR